MTGIVGLHSLDGTPRPDQRAVVDAMVRRAAGTPGIELHAGTQIGLRHLGTAPAAQDGPAPQHNEDRSVWAVCSGGLDNGPALRRELQALGHVLRTGSDAECVAHAWETWREGVFARLRGSFSIAILDLREAKLVLARDRVGLRPLHYAVTPDRQLVFASEVKCLLAAPGLRPAVSAPATLDYFALGYVPAPRSIWEGVHKLPPGHCLIACGGRTTVRPYWRLAYGPKRPGGEGELQAQLRERLEEAVRVRVGGDGGPVGVFLSGGLDSGVVAALAARELGRPLQTFSIGFREDEVNELPDARAVARHLGAEHHELVVGADAAPLMQQLAWYFEEPFGDASAIPTYLLSQLAARHVGTVLTGDGGDEVFAGYERYRRFRRLDAFARGTLGLGAPALRLASQVFDGQRARRLGRIADRVAQSWPDRYLSGVALSTAADLRGLLSPEFAGADPYAGIRHHFAREDIAEPMERVLCGDIASYLADDVLVKVERMTRANGLEARAPLLDTGVMEFAARLPAELKLQRGRSKYLLRRLARELLPARVLARPKQGLELPLSRWLRGELRELMLDTLSGARLAQRGIFNVAGIGRCIGEHLAGTHDHGTRLWLLLSYELWTRRFADELTPASVKAA